MKINYKNFIQIKSENIELYSCGFFIMLIALSYLYNIGLGILLTAIIAVCAIAVGILAYYISKRTTNIYYFPLEEGDFYLNPSTMEECEIHSIKHSFNGVPYVRYFINNERDTSKSLCVTEGEFRSIFPIKK